MELIITVGFPNGQISAKVETFAQGEQVRNWLAKQGLINGVPAEAQVEREPFEPGADIHPITEPAPLPADEALTPQQADAEAEAQRVAAELAEQAAAQDKAAKKAAAAARKAAKEAKPANDIAAVTKAVTDYAAKFGPQEARALFARFGVSRGGDLKPEQFDEFVSVAVDYLARGIKATEGDTADLM